MCLHRLQYIQIPSTADTTLFRIILIKRTLTLVPFEPAQYRTTSHNGQLATPTTKIGKYQQPTVAIKPRMSLPDSGLRAKDRQISYRYNTISFMVA